MRKIIEGHSDPSELVKITDVQGYPLYVQRARLESDDSLDIVIPIFYSTGRPRGGYRSSGGWEQDHIHKDNIRRPGNEWGGRDGQSWPAE